MVLFSLTISNKWFMSKNCIQRLKYTHRYSSTSSSSSHSSWACVPRPSRWTACQILCWATISSGAVQENEMETLLRHLKLFHLKHNESKTYHISRRDLDNFRFLQVPPHLLTLAVQVKTAPCVSRWYKTCETSSIRCQYQATVAARIGFANSQNHCIRICMNLYPVELCAFAFLGALNHDRPIVACPDLALWRYCWLCWAKVSGRSMKKLSFSRHEAFIIEQEIMLASLGSVWFDEVTHPHKRSSCQKMS